MTPLGVIYNFLLGSKKWAFRHCHCNLSKIQTSPCFFSHLFLSLCVSKSRKPLHVCLGLCVFRSKKPSPVCPSLKTMAFALCASPRKQHLPSPMLSTPLLCALLQENNINATITNLHSLCLCYVRFSKKITSMPPSPTYVLPTCAIYTFPRRRCQRHHHQLYSKHQGNQLFLTLNQKFPDLLSLHVARF